MFVPGKLHGGVHLLHDLMWHMFATTMCTCKWSCVRAGSWLSKHPLLHAVILRWHFSVIYFKILWLCRLRLYFWGSFHIQIWWNLLDTAVKMNTEYSFMSLCPGVLWKTISFQVCACCLHAHFGSHLISDFFIPIHFIQLIVWSWQSDWCDFSAYSRCRSSTVCLRLMVAPCLQTLFLIFIQVLSIMCTFHL